MTKKKTTKIKYYSKPSTETITRIGLAPMFVSSTTAFAAKRSLEKQQRRYEVQQGKILAKEIPTKRAMEFQELRTKKEAATEARFKKIQKELKGTQKIKEKEEATKLKEVTKKAENIAKEKARRLQSLKAKLSKMASKTMRKPPVKMPDVGQKKRMVVRIEQPPPGTIRFAFRQIYSRQTPYNSQNILEWGKKH